MENNEALWIYLSEISIKLTGFMYLTSQSNLWLKNIDYLETINKIINSWWEIKNIISNIYEISNEWIDKIVISCKNDIIKQLEEY